MVCWQIQRCGEAQRESTRCHHFIHDFCLCYRWPVWPWCDRAANQGQCLISSSLWIAQIFIFCLSCFTIGCHILSFFPSISVLNPLPIVTLILDFLFPSSQCQTNLIYFSWDNIFFLWICSLKFSLPLVFIYFYLFIEFHYLFFLFICILFIQSQIKLFLL